MYENSNDMQITMYYMNKMIIPRIISMVRLSAY